MRITSPNQLVAGQEYYAVQGVAATVINRYVYREHYDAYQAHNDSDNKTICNWACFTTYLEAENFLKDRIETVRLG